MDVGVMQLVTEGFSNKLIAKQLGISMQRMDAANMADLVRKVLIIQSDADN